LSAAIKLKVSLSLDFHRQLDGRCEQIDDEAVTDNNLAAKNDAEDSASHASSGWGRSRR